MSALITAEYFNEQMATFGLKATFAPSSYQLDTLITEASDWVEGYCDRKFALQDATAIMRGPVRVGNKLVLDDYPVTEVQSIDWTDGFQTGSYDPALVRILSGGVLEVITPSWFFENDKVYTIAYETGYAVIPSNVQRAVGLKIANLIQPQYQGPQDREDFMVTNLDQMIVDLLEPYRRERVA
jgi:hypothetical protein